METVTRETGRMWNEARVREELPDVAGILPNGTRAMCILSGRKNAFATARPRDGAGEFEAQFAWATIAGALNSNRPLRF